MSMKYANWRIIHLHVRQFAYFILIFTITCNNLQQWHPMRVACYSFSKLSEAYAYALMIIKSDTFFSVTCCVDVDRCSGYQIQVNNNIPEGLPEIKVLESLPLEWLRLNSECNWTPSSTARPVWYWCRSEGKFWRSENILPVRGWRSSLFRLQSVILEPPRLGCAGPRFASLLGWSICPQSVAGKHVQSPPYPSLWCNTWTYPSDIAQLWVKAR